MSIDNLHLSPTVIFDLYRDVLVDTNSPKPRQTSVKSKSISFLGENGKRIAILVNNDEISYLPDNELQFLTGILTACKLDLADVAIINLAKNSSINYSLLSEELSAEKILLFGVSPNDIDLPLQFPNYQVQRYNNQIYLSSPVLSALIVDKNEKLKLWNSLKQVFNI
jgi:hypothetical protein